MKKDDKLKKKSEKRKKMGGRIFALIMIVFMMLPLGYQLFHSVQTVKAPDKRTELVEKAQKAQEAETEKSFMYRDQNEETTELDQEDLDFEVVNEDGQATGEEEPYVIEVLDENGEPVDEDHGITIVDSPDGSEEADLPVENDSVGEGE